MRHVPIGRARAGLFIVVLVAPLLAVLAPGTAASANPTRPVQAPQPSGLVGQAQALDRAAATGTAVPVTAATTPTSTLTANPDGTLTLTQNVEPIRTYRGGKWVTLDATLHANRDGTVTPAATASPVTLSGGGTRPAAVLTDAGHQLSLTWPTPLPAPALSGPTATYADVLPGVDLVVTVDTQGGVSDTVVVKTAAAASNPKLVELTMAVSAPGLTVSSDATGNLAARTAGGVPLFTAPTPLAWDSSSNQGAAQSAGRTHISTSHGPGGGATVMRLPDTVDGGTLTLKPPAGLLHGAGVTFPVYFDPAWTATGGGDNGWASVSENHPDSNYWKDTPDPGPEKYLQVGNSGSQWSRTVLRFPIPLSTLHGAVIHQVQLTVMEENSWSCTASQLNLYAPTKRLTPDNATWNNWNADDIGSPVDGGSWAYGHSSSCPAHAVNFSQFNTDSNHALVQAISNDVASSRYDQSFVLAGVNEANDTNSWKEFLSSSPSLTITYDRPPATPSGLSTDPATSCANADGDLVGDTDVTLFAPISDPDGGSVGATITLTNTTTGAVVATSNPANLITSGSIARLVVPATTLATSAAGAVTKFSWNVRATDTNLQSGVSQTCSFRFDPTRPSDKPTITISNPDTPTIGQPIQVSISPPTGAATPGAYLYQLNDTAPAELTANSDGTASITMIPTRYTNVLTATEVSAAGNLGTVTARIVFTANPDTSKTSVDWDLTGDGAMDLITTGRTSGGGNVLPAGIWQAAGKNTGQVVATASNIGANGDGFSLGHGPADFADAQVITGHFTDSDAGPVRQDVLAYYPQGHPNGTNIGRGVVIPSNGDGSILTGQLYDEAVELDPPTLADFATNSNGDYPLQVASAGPDTVSGTGLTDLVAINGNATSGYRLDYYVQFAAQSFVPVALTDTTTPTGGTDWNTWTIASTVLSTDTGTSTDLFLWQPTTGQLYLWRNIALTVDANTDAINFSTGAKYQLSATTPWNTNQALAIQAADVNSDGSPDLWAVGAGGQVTAWITNPNNPASTTSKPAQTLQTAAHAWMLNDASSGTVTAHDSGGGSALDATGTGGAAWHNGDLYDPDVALDGTGALFTTVPAVATNQNFSVSVWVKPDAAGGTVLSQDATSTAGFRLWAESTDGSWRFGMPTTDVASPTLNVAAAPAGTVQRGVWTHLMATYTKANGQLSLYVNGVKTAAVVHTATSWNAAGGLQIGRAKNGASSYGNYLAGQVSQVQTWNQVIDPAQAATPPSWYHPVSQTRIMDTRNGTGGTTGTVASFGTARLPITGRSGVPDDGTVTAVAVNVTVLPSTANSGYVTVYPDDTARPVVSTINYAGGQIIANYTIVPVGPDGGIALFNAGAGTVHLLVDISGYYTSDPAAAGISSYTPVTPTRILNTRTGLGAPVGQIQPGKTLTVTIAGANGVPAGATAAALNFTTSDQTASGYLTTWPHGQTRPVVSGVQYSSNRSIADMSIVALGTGGAIDIYVGPTGSTNIIVDVIGYYTAGTTGLAYHPTPATRLVDTRTTNSPLSATTRRAFNQGNTVIAPNPTLVTNITAVGGTAGGWVTAYPDGTVLPGTSNLNWQPGLTIAALALPTTGTGTSTGTIDVYNGSAGTVHVIIDILGYFAAS